MTNAVLNEGTSHWSSCEGYGLGSPTWDGDGVISSGKELFGDVTPQPSSDRPNGFAAHWVYDQPEFGGNDDGRLTVADREFASLLLWRDLNHDGLSQAAELTILAEHGVIELHLDPVRSGRRDRYGNRLAWTARVRFGTGWRPAAADVIFLVEQQPAPVRRQRVK